MPLYQNRHCSNKTTCQYAGLQHPNKHWQAVNPEGMAHHPQWTPMPLPRVLHPATKQTILTRPDNSTGIVQWNAFQEFAANYWLLARASQQNYFLLVINVTTDHTTCAVSVLQAVQGLQHATHGLPEHRCLPVPCRPGFNTGRPATAKWLGQERCQVQILPTAGNCNSGLFFFSNRLPSSCYISP